MEEAAQEKAAKEEKRSVMEDEQSVSELPSKVDNVEPEERNGKPALQPPVVETKEVKEDNTAHSAAAVMKVVTETQAEAKGGCCVIL